jgi:hypothetical protein
MGLNRSGEDSAAGLNPIPRLTPLHDWQDAQKDQQRDPDDGKNGPEKDGKNGNKPELLFLNFFNLHRPGCIFQSEASPPGIAK